MEEADYPSRSTTPIKNVRSRKSSGGLTPLPAELPISIIDPSSDYDNIAKRQELNNIIEVSKSSCMNDILEAEDASSDSIINQKISCGLKKIQELDEILTLKSKIAKELQTDRIKREVTPDQTDNESCNPASSSRIKIGKDQLLQKTNSSVNPTPIGYETGNFVQRNIVLGKDARYYHAMSQLECDRVESILDNPEFDNETIDDCASSVDRPQSALTGFYPDPKDLNRLLEIDKELQKIVPESDWETKSLVWSSNMPSGATTPLSSIRQPIHVDSVLETLSYDFSLNYERLKEIDERLNELQNSNLSDNVKLDPKQLEFLISQTMLEEKQQFIN